MLHLIRRHIGTMIHRFALLSVESHKNTCQEKHVARFATYLSESHNYMCS